MIWQDLGEQCHTFPRQLLYLHIAFNDLSQITCQFCLDRYYLLLPMAFGHRCHVPLFVVAMWLLLVVIWRSVVSSLALSYWGRYLFLLLLGLITVTPVRNMPSWVGLRASRRDPWLAWEPEEKPHPMALAFAHCAVCTFAVTEC